VNAISPACSAQTFASAQILVVEDDVGLRDEVADYLSKNGYVAHTATSAHEMDNVLATTPVDLIVLDVMLPGENGLSICRRVTDPSGPAIIIMSAMGEEVDRVVGLELGADDYLSKPVSPRELLARVRAVLRRRETAPVGQKAGSVYHFAGFQLDIGRRQLRAPEGVVILLTPGEFSLLAAFLENPGQVLSRDSLVEQVCGDGADVFDRAIDVQLSRLRSKLKVHGGAGLIRTVRGSGYICDAQVTLR
jgi:two-component system OmpR family response regulator